MGVRGARWTRTRGTKTGCMGTHPRRPNPHVNWAVGQPRLDVRHHAMREGQPRPFGQTLRPRENTAVGVSEGCQQEPRAHTTHKQVCHDHSRMGILPFVPTRRVHCARAGEGGQGSALTRASYGVPQVECSPRGTGGTQGRFTHGEHGAVVGMKSQALGGMQEPVLAAHSGETGCSESP